MKNTELALSLLTAPGAAFRDLDQRPRFWFALLVALGVSVGLYGWYYFVVDLRWLMELQLDANPRGAQMPEAQREMALSNAGILRWSSLIAIPVVLVGVRLLEATYWLLAGKLTNVQRSFKHWFSLSCWIGLPALIGLLPAVPLLLLSESRQIPVGTLSPLSLNELFFHRAMASPGYTLLNALSLLTPWLWWLAAYAIRTWSGRSWTFSAIYALLPQILIYGIWAAIAFR